MTEQKTGRLQGTLGPLVRDALALGPLHGSGVSGRVQHNTSGTFVVEPGSLVPALHRMEEAAGGPASVRGESEDRRRATSDRLTAAGVRPIRRASPAMPRCAGKGRTDTRSRAR